MKKFELIVGFLAVLGIVIKLLHLPGGGFLTTLTVSTLSMFYYLFSFALFNNIRLKDIFKKASYKNTNAKRIIGAVGLGFAISSITLGGLFKLQFWPGANVQLLAGLLTAGLIFIIALIFYFRNKSDYYTRIFKRIAIYGILGFVFYATPTNTMVDIYYRNNPDYAELYKKVLAQPENQELREQLQQLKHKMHYPELNDDSEENK